MESARRVLLVEDYPPCSRAFKRVLSRCFGFDVTIAERGEAAIGQFGDVEPDLLLLDMQLPGIKGYPMKDGRWTTSPMC